MGAGLRKTLRRRPATKPTSTTSAQADAGEAPLLHPPAVWVAFATGVGAVALGGVAIWQVASANSSYSDAQKLVQPDGSRSDQARYDALMADSESSRKRAVAAGIGAGVCAVATGILGYLAYQQTGEVGPFRF